MSESIGRHPIETSGGITETLNNVLDRLPAADRKPSEMQQQALELVGDDFVIKMRAHVYDDLRRQEERRKQDLTNDIERYKKNPDRYIKRLLKGEVFEYLVARDPNVRNAWFGSNANVAENQSRFQQVQRVEAEIDSVIQDPSRYGLEIESFRLPDEAYIDVTSEGEVVILGVGESKSGYISNRLDSQMGYFEEGAQNVARALSKLRHKKQFLKHGLNALADRMESSGLEGRNNFVRVSPDFEKNLIVPADRNLDKVKVDWNSIDRVSWASFTEKEVEAIRDWVIDEIRKEDPTF